MASVQPLPTTYLDVRFRSRTEARWAVFFDALQLRWSYEDEGYELFGTWYLPDFYLPDLDIFWEVKGCYPAPEEQEKASDLHLVTDRPVCIAVGPPALLKDWSKPQILAKGLAADLTGYADPANFACWAEIEEPRFVCPVAFDSNVAGVWIPHDWLRSRGDDGPGRDHAVSFDSDLLKHAVTKSRSFRFWDPK